MLWRDDRQMLPPSCDQGYATLGPRHRGGQHVQAGHRVRLRPGPPARPPRGRSRRTSRTPHSSRTTRRGLAYSAFGQQDVSGHHAPGGDRGERHRRTAGYHDAPRDGPDPRRPGQRGGQPTASSPGCGHHPGDGERRSPPSWKRWSRTGDRRRGRLLARGPGGGQDRDRPGRCQQPAGRRLDDRLRPGHQTDAWRSPSLVPSQRRRLSGAEVGRPGVSRR